MTAHTRFSVDAIRHDYTGYDTTTCRWQYRALQMERDTTRYHKSKEKLNEDGRTKNTMVFYLYFLLAFGFVSLVMLLSHC